MALHRNMLRPGHRSPPSAGYFARTGTRTCKLYAVVWRYKELECLSQLGPLVATSIERIILDFPSVPSSATSMRRPESSPWAIQKKTCIFILSSTWTRRPVLRSQFGDMLAVP